MKKCFEEFYTIKIKLGIKFLLRNNETHITDRLVDLIKKSFGTAAVRIHSDIIRDYVLERTLARIKYLNNENEKYGKKSLKKDFKMYY